MDVFVSSVRGHVVGRLGTGTATQKDAQIGTRFDTDLGEMVWDEDEVIKLPEPHYLENQRYYDKALAGGALKSRTREEWEAWQAGEKDRVDKEQIESEKRRAAELAEGAKAAELEALKEAQHQRERRERLQVAKLEMERRRVAQATQPAPSTKSKQGTPTAPIVPKIQPKKNQKAGS